MTLAVRSLYISKHSQTFALLLLLFLAAYIRLLRASFSFFSPPSFVCLCIFLLFEFAGSWRKYMAWLWWDDMR